jgi:Amt family ammonium transporter
MFKYVKAIFIIILLLLGASLVNGQDIQAADSSAATVSETLLAPDVQISEVEVDAAYTTMDEFKASPDYITFMINNVWILLSAMLVFVMHLGFATVESGMMPAKNTANVIYKNIFILTTGILTYSIVGFSLMYPGDFNIIDGVLGFKGFGIGYKPGNDIAFLSTEYGDLTIWTDFLFQAMFAATAATIVSGAVTGRIKMSSYMIYTGLIVAVSYPITGSWKWGFGWLDTMGFHDFAGSTLVHGVGGAAAFVGAWLLGPRIGKFIEGKAQDIPGHNLPLATIGVLLLWFGWFGFNGGSVLSADPAAISLVMVNTALAAAAGSLAAMATATFTLHKMDLAMALNGILGGLVGITAGADVVDPGSSIIIGALSGALVVLAISGIEKMGIDDPVGAVAVHGVCGIWGTLAVGIFAADKSFVTQLIGTSAVIGFTLVFSAIVFLSIKYSVGVRAEAKAEIEGMDAYYHGHTAYPDFMANK